MNVNISDQNGRALEYYITACICKKFPAVQLSARAIHDQERDKQKFHSLETPLVLRFERAAIVIGKWLEDNFSLSKGLTITLDRLPDSASRKGDVTDIRIVVDGRVINLSLKHNHAALKHQRPNALPQQLGISRNDKRSVAYRLGYQEITSQFLAKAKKNFPGVTSFKKIKENNTNYINENFYRPVCEHVSNFMNLVRNESASNFFSFVVGSTSFYKLIVYADHVEIYQFNDIKTPTNFSCTVHNCSYVKVEFSNQWEISMRIHTASSRLETLSLKFDTQAIKISVPKTTLTYDAQSS